MMSCSFAVLPQVGSSLMKFSSQLPLRLTHNALTKTEPQLTVSLLTKPGLRFMTSPKTLSITNSSSQCPGLLSKSSPLFSDGITNSNLSVMSTVGDRQKSITTLANIFAAYPLINVSRPGNLQVFINYRGEEVGHNFVSHLTDAFERVGIKFYIDKDEKRGKDLEHLFVRIEESKIGLPIFSTRYPESKWCMDELVKMKKCADDGKLIIVPVFYKVEPSDVRKPTSESEFGKNFWRLVEESDQSDPIQEWRKALEGISNKMGLTLGDQSPEADFIKKIVKAVQTAIKDEKD